MATPESDTDFFDCDFQLVFEFELPYRVTFNSEIRIAQYFQTKPRIVYFMPHVVIQTITLVSSVLLFASSLKVIKDILCISEAVTNPEFTNRRRRTLVLNFNHCRFISNFTFKQKSERLGCFSSTIEHLKSFKLSFFVSLLHYALNIVLFGVAMKDVFTTGMISGLQIFLISTGVFLGCADIATIYVFEEHYDLMRVLFNQYAVKLLYFTAGTVMVFYIMTFIFYTFYGDSANFSSLSDCVNTLIALMLGDSVLDIFNDLDDNLGIVLTFLFTLVFHLSLIQIFMGVMASSFQKAKQDFVQVEKAKEQKIKALVKKAKHGLRKFKTTHQVEENIQREFIDQYHDRIIDFQHLNVPTRGSQNDADKLEPGSRFVSPQPPKSSGKTEQRPIEPLTEINRHTSDSYDSSKINELFNEEVTHDINNYIAKQLRKRSNSSENDNTAKFDALSQRMGPNASTYVENAIKSLTFELVILIRYNVDLLKKYLSEFKYMTENQKFNFLLVIASSELCDNLLHNFELLKKKIDKIQPSPKRRKKPRC